MNKIIFPSREEPDEIQEQEQEQQQPQDIIPTSEFARLEDRASGIFVELHSVIYNSNELLNFCLQALDLIRKKKTNGNQSKYTG